MIIFPIHTPGKGEIVRDDDGLILKHSIDGVTQFILSKDKKKVCFYPDSYAKDLPTIWVSLELLRVPLRSDHLSGIFFKDTVGDEVET